MSSYIPSQFHSHLDRLVRSLVTSGSFFRRGWGDPRIFRECVRVRHDLVGEGRRERRLFDGFDKLPPVRWTPRPPTRNATVALGEFVSPQADLLGGGSNGRARFELLLPRSALQDAAAARDAPRRTPVCALLPPTGDHGFRWRRTLLGEQLARRGIGSVILEIPFYGARKPTQQWRSSLLHLCDLFTMGAGILYELAFIFRTLETEHGCGPFVVQGLSLGGYMASMVACAYPDAVGLVPVVAPSNATGVFCKGVLSHSVAKRAFGEQLCDADFRRRLAEAVEMPALDQLRVEQFEVPSNRKLDPLALLGQHALTQVLNEFTDLEKMESPILPEAATQIVALHDQYLPTYRGDELARKWEGSRLQLLDAGHVSTLIYLGAIVDAISDVANRVRAHEIENRA